MYYNQKISIQILYCFVLIFCNINDKICYYFKILNETVKVLKYYKMIK